jgi:hypothetical protein
VDEFAEGDVTKAAPKELVKNKRMSLLSMAPVTSTRAASASSAVPMDTKVMMDTKV